MHEKKKVLSPEDFKKQIVTRIGHDKLFSWANEKGIKRWVIETIEKGKIPEKHEHLVALADALDVSLDWLLTGAETKEEKPVFLNDEEKKLVEDLLKILRGHNRINAVAIKSNIKAFAFSADIEADDEAENEPTPPFQDKKKGGMAG